MTPSLVERAGPMPTDEQRAFWAAIRADPLDDTPIRRSAVPEVHFGWSSLEEGNRNADDAGS